MNEIALRLKTRLHPPRTPAPRLSPGKRTNHHEWLVAARDRIGQQGVRQVLGQILLAGKEPQERTPLLGCVIADRTKKDRVAGFERVKHRPLRHRPWYVEADLSLHAHQPSQMRRKLDPD